MNRLFTRIMWAVVLVLVCVMFVAVAQSRGNARATTPPAIRAGHTVGNISPPAIRAGHTVGDISPPAIRAGHTVGDLSPH